MLKSMTFRSILAAVACAFPLAAYAITHQPNEIDIPAGELSEALRQLSNQYGADLVYRPEQVYGVQTHGAHGNLTSEEAVKRLLEGSKLQVSTGTTGTMTIAVPRSLGMHTRSPSTMRSTQDSESEEHEKKPGGVDLG